jgi:hypothetical protein
LKDDATVGTQKDSGHVNKVISRALYAVPMRDTMPVAAASEPHSETETNGVGLDVLISVWWDQPPCEDPQ